MLYNVEMNKEKLDDLMAPFENAIFPCEDADCIDIEHVDMSYEDFMQLLHDTITEAWLIGVRDKS